MGLKFKLAKEFNHIYADFDNAYWAIDNIVVYPENRQSYVHFELTAYASRDAKHKNMQTVAEPSPKEIPLGGAVSAVYNTELYKAVQELPTANLFDTVPNTISAQKDILYAYIKTLLDNAEITYEDVLEENNGLLD